MQHNYLKHAVTIITAATLLGLSAFAAAAPASKFAAHVATAGANLHLLHSGVADTTDASPQGTCVDGDYLYDPTNDVCVTAGNNDTILTATIKTANKKDLLIGVSLQNGIYTETNVKGKNGSAEKAGAAAGILVHVAIDGEHDLAFPSSVVFANRIQELSATLGGVIESCAVTVTDNGDGTSSGTINVANDCVVSDEEIGLILSTTSANHFNFVAPNLSAGEHTVTVHATALSSAAYTNGTYTTSDEDQATCEGNGGTFDGGICTYTTTDNEAKAWALVDVGSLTVEEVRAINQEGGIVIDDNAGCYDSTGAYTCP